MTFLPFRTSSPAACQGTHRGPQGPCEDLAQCPTCFGVTWRMRPEGETFGLHADDCAAPERHEGYCPPGGSGHPPAKLIRGYWPCNVCRHEHPTSECTRLVRYGDEEFPCGCPGCTCPGEHDDEAECPASPPCSCSEYLDPYCCRHGDPGANLP